MNRTPWQVELSPAAAIAVGGTANAQPYTTDGDHFVIEEIYSIVENTGGGGTATARTALPLLGASKAADATSPTMNMVEAKVTIGGESWSDRQVPICMIGLPPSENGVLRTPFVVPPNKQMNAAFTNNCPAGYTVTPRIFFKGYKTSQMPTMP